MNAIAERYGKEKVGSIFLYTHEAHPGELYPHLTSMEQKFEHAAALRSILNVTRPILVDTLDGACHRAYGSMPNSTWIFSKTGVVMYKSDWTDVVSVEMMLEYLLSVRARRRSGERLAPFRVERVDFRTQDREGFYEGLARSGQKAVDEFRKAFG